ncbi:MAG: PASTA domain-containing protein [Muribaculaceae bacterium]|nr:PASTA domain-containing protein [Muribaculaceae bacterium]
MLFLIDVFTEHGHFKVVPSVKNMSLRQAINKIEAEGFRWEISDSIYNDKLAPGMVVEQNPKANSKVKSNRVIFIGINALTPRMVTYPSIKDISIRQAQAKLEGLGLKNIRIETVYSPFKGLVIDSKINGLSISGGTKIPASSYITLQVGDGAETENVIDSLTEESASGTDVSDFSGENSTGVDFMQ